MYDIEIKDTNLFEKIINELEEIESKIEESFENQNNNFITIDGNDNYKGNCQTVISEKYNEFKKNYEPIGEALTNYTKYLKITLENYITYINTLNNSIDENQDNLMIN